MNPLVYTPQEILALDRRVETLLQRYAVPAFAPQPLDEIALQMDFEATFFARLVEGYLNPNSISEENFQCFDVPVLVDYLQKSHRFYLENRLPKIGQYIYLLVSNYPKGHPLLASLSKLFIPYSQHLEQHIKEEESNLFPYALDLFEHVRGGTVQPSILMSAYSVLDFCDHHDDTETILSTMRRVIHSYEPPKTNSTPYRILINLLAHFEEDLKIHALIEDKVLAPKLWALESEWKAQHHNWFCFGSEN